LSVVAIAFLVISPSVIIVVVVVAVIVGVATLLLLLLLWSWLRCVAVWLRLRLWLSRQMQMGGYYRTVMEARGKECDVAVQHEAPEFLACLDLDLSGSIVQRIKWLDLPGIEAQPMCSA